MKAETVSRRFFLRLAVPAAAALAAFRPPPASPPVAVAAPLPPPVPAAPAVGPPGAALRFLTDHGLVLGEGRLRGTAPASHGTIPVEGEVDVTAAGTACTYTIVGDAWEVSGPASELNLNSYCFWPGTRVVLSGVLGLPQTGAV